MTRQRPPRLPHLARVYSAAHGRYYTVPDLAAELGVTRQAIYQRLVWEPLGRDGGRWVCRPARIRRRSNTDA